MAVSLSVVVPVYNKERYVRQCIDSLLAQSGADFEIIAVNDGSTDASGMLLNEYSDKRLKIIECPNGGVSNARNIGLTNSTKDFVTFVDADDCIEPGFLAACACEIEKYRCDILLAGLTKFSESGPERKVCSSLPEGVIESPEFDKLFVRQMFDNEGIFGYVAGKFIKRSLVIENNLKFDTTLKLAEDLDFWISAYCLKVSMAISHSTAYRYRQATECSSIFLSSQHLSQLDLWIKIYNIYTTEEDIDSRKLVLQKLNRIRAAHFLELKSISHEAVKSEMRIVNKKLDGIYDLTTVSETFFQKLLHANSVLPIWLYLKLRYIYHRLR